MKPFLTSTTVVAVACFATASTAAPMCAELLLVDQLGSKYQRLAPIHSDTATGWIFTNDQMSEDYSLKSEARHLMAEIVHEFDRRAIELALLIAPPRPLVAGEEVVRETLGANGDFDVARGGWCADYNEASTFLDLMTTTHGSNAGKYSNAMVDDLMKQSKTAANPQPLYTKVEEIVADEVGLIPIYHYANTFMLNADLKGFPFENAENNWYVKEFYRVAN